MEIFLRFAVGFWWNDQDASRARIFSWSAWCDRTSHSGSLPRWGDCPEWDTWPVGRASRSQQNTHLGVGYGLTGTRPARRAGKTRTRGFGSHRGAWSWRSYSYANFPVVESLMRTLLWWGDMCFLSAACETFTTCLIISNGRQTKRCDITKLIVSIYRGGDVTIRSIEFQDTSSIISYIWHHLVLCDI